MRLLDNIGKYLKDIFEVTRQEFTAVFSSLGAMIFFFLLPTAYPIAYSLIYNPEVAHEVPVVVVDDSRTPMSREFTRKIDATPDVQIIGYAADIPEARKALAEDKSYGIMYIPESFERNIERGEVANVDFFAETGLLLRYKSILVAANNVSLAMGAEIQARELSSASSLTVGGALPIENYSFPMGDVSMGLGSFILPGILILILQQSMLLGVGFLGGAANERRRKNRGYDPESAGKPVGRTMIGKAICYFLLYIPATIYVTLYVPRFFLFPQSGLDVEILLFMVPMIIASIFFAMTMELFIRDREDVFIMFVFTSVIFLFASGLTWPRYAMPWYWKELSYIFPGAWGLDGFIRINGNGASLYQVKTDFYWLWGLAAFYFVAAYILHSVKARKYKRTL